VADFPSPWDVTPDERDFVQMSIGGQLVAVTQANFITNFLGGLTGTTPDKHDRVLMGIGPGSTGVVSVSRDDFIINFLGGLVKTTPDANDLVIMSIGGQRVGVTRAAFIAGGWGEEEPDPEAPVNLIPPGMGGDLEQGGTLIFAPGTWDNAETYRYRVLRGDVTGPTDPEDVLLDWTTDTSALVEDIEDGDYLWLQEEATGPYGVTVATAVAGHGPMEALAFANATIIGVGGLNTATTASATTYTFDMDITDTPARGLLLHLQCQGQKGASNPTWSAVTIDGIPLTYKFSGEHNDGSNRDQLVEVWELWGNDLPVGTGLTVSATKSASTNSMRSTLAAVAIGNTQATAPAAGAMAFQADAAQLDAYSFPYTTTLADRLIIAFCCGQWVSTSATGVFTGGTGWIDRIEPWPGSRNGTSLAWAAAMTRAQATAATFTVDFAHTEGGNLHRYGSVTTIEIAGNNA